MTQLKKKYLYRQKWPSFPFFYLFARVSWFTVQRRRGKIMWNFLWFSVPKRGWAVFYTASFFHQMKRHEASYHTVKPLQSFFGWLSFFTHSYQMVILVWGMIVTPLTFLTILKNSSTNQRMVLRCAKYLDQNIFDLFATKIGRWRLTEHKSTLEKPVFVNWKTVARIAPYFWKSDFCC